MSLFAYSFRIAVGRGDRKRDRNLVKPENIRALYNLPYGLKGKYQLLDLYFPKGTEKPLPVIVSVHGGGYVYGTKEVYAHYCMFLAQQGFAVVNFNYTLAPERKFPNQLIETNMVMNWLVKNKDRYPVDIENVFVVGDSAGAQLASHYCAIHTNEKFEALFPFCTPKECKIKAVGLNCGLYDITNLEALGLPEKEAKGITRDYLGSTLLTDERLRVLNAITEKFPPAYVMSSEYDFLKGAAQPMYDHLKSKGVETELHIYKSKKIELGHVFHANMNLREAKKCNIDECRFFKKHM